MTKVEIQQHIGKVLQQLRKKKKLTLREVGVKLSAHTSHVSQIEHGLVMPSVMTLHTFCQLYEISSSELLPF